MVVLGLSLLLRSERDFAHRAFASRSRARASRPHLADQAKAFAAPFPALSLRLCGPPLNPSASPLIARVAFSHSASALPSLGAASNAASARSAMTLATA